MKDTNITVDSETGRATIEIHNFVGNKTMNMYMGTFECKCLLTASDYIRMNRDFVNMVGASPDNDPTKIAFALVQLKYRLTKFAPFWKAEDGLLHGGHIEDYNLITHLYNACLEAEKQYQDMMKEQFEQNKERIAKQRKAIAEKMKKEAEDTPEEEEDVELL